MVPEVPGRQGIHPIRGLGEPFLAQAPSPNRACDRCNDVVDDVFPGQLATDAERVTSGDQSQDGAVRDAAISTQTPHLERIAYRQAVEPKLVAQQPRHHFAADRGGQVVDGGHHDMRAHDRPHPSRDRCFERLEGVLAGVLTRHRKRQM